VAFESRVATKLGEVPWLRVLAFCLTVAGPLALLTLIASGRIWRAVWVLALTYVSTLSIVTVGFVYRFHKDGSFPFPEPPWHERRQTD